MKKIVIVLLLASIGLLAADGEKLYKQRCSLCHGENAQKSPLDGVAAIAGMDVTVLALTIRAYRDQDSRVGAYTMHKSSQLMKDSTSGLTRDMIVAIAKYVSELK
ncbi:MAG: c-type cytochrome [Sulfurimonas sp.]|uniref:c-type cytochrome n=1 Tax=Sulfurimonas sp. TaxID=2022749 RepID=UPI0025DE39B7|nr:c-type cytochrome [Sulfurimonas sp.]MCK9492199.1 c-type cytochrome [Sulfurimonas sp.]